ncbi:hypothetical protein [Sphingobium sp. LB126]|uniref:hypothetical protein n=1 Tax=Sphingobium sp. LB126 TaxID=1983755 RepID=UPI0012FE5544|nr:hypothetical protein [Sphingobium sp. LB126]
MPARRSPGTGAERSGLIALPHQSKRSELDPEFRTHRPWRLDARRAVDARHESECAIRLVEQVLRPEGDLASRAAPASGLKRSFATVQALGINELISSLMSPKQDFAHPCKSDDQNPGHHEMPQDEWPAETFVPTNHGD